jgi:hypothetical protein
MNAPLARMLATTLTLLACASAPAHALDQRAELQKIVQTEMPKGLVLASVSDRFKHNAECIAYYSLRALEQGNQLGDDPRYAAPAKRYYNGNLLIAKKEGYDKWQSAGYVLARQKELAKQILAADFESVLESAGDAADCSFQYRNRKPKHAKPTIQIFQ